MGKFEIIENLPDGKEKKIAEIPNRIVYDGREYMMDMAFGVNSWYRGEAIYESTGHASGYYRPGNEKIIAIGITGDDNSGWLASQGYIEGGTGFKSSTIPLTGTTFAHLPNLEDSHMSSYQAVTGNGIWYGSADRVIREGRVLTIEKIFEGTALESETGQETILAGQEIRELGIFLGGDPTGAITPSTDITERPYAMIARSVRYEVNGDYIEDDPIVMGENSITVRYTFSDT